MTTAHEFHRHCVSMFEKVVMGIRDDGEADRDAIALAGALLSLAGELTLVGVHVVASTPAPDSGAQETLRSGATALPPG
jgi:hypothetical protein